MIHTHQISRDVEVNLNLFWDRVKYNCHLNKKNNWRFPNKHMCLWTFVSFEALKYDPSNVATGIFGSET